MKNDIKELSKKAYYIYLNSTTIDQYYKELKELADQYDLTIDYAKGLRDYYDFYLATNMEKNQCREVMSLHNVNNNISKVEKLLSMSDYEQQKYFLDNNINYSDLSNYCAKYVKKYGNNDRVIQLLNNYSRLRDEKALNESKARYSHICKLFDDIINSGCYSIVDYSYLYCDKNGISKNAFKVDAFNDLKYLERNYTEKYKFYCDKMALNKKILFDSYYDIMSSFCKQNLDSLDVIDYYLCVGLPIRRALDIIGDIEEFSKLKYFLTINNINRRPHTGVASYVTRDILLKQDIEINGISVNDDDKILVLDFMEEHNIPIGYFSLALRKYINGNLNEYRNGSNKL